ncbi:nitroreductase family protein [Geodermatophilus amargosae]|uniref:nitroreductase family protein n=1 Tax=Geodermatophilus amargosae TaxID=1296565 RepID=UPI0034DF5D8E
MLAAITQAVQLRTRCSCRAFRPDPVPGDVVDEVLRLAQATPSWCDTQPWQGHLLSGEATTRFGEELGEHVLSGAGRWPTSACRRTPACTPSGAGHRATASTRRSASRARTGPPARSGCSRTPRSPAPRTRRW